MESVDFSESVRYGVVTVSTVLLTLPELAADELQDPVACISNKTITNRMRIKRAIRINFVLCNWLLWNLIHSHSIVFKQAFIESSLIVAFT